MPVRASALLNRAPARVLHDKLEAAFDASASRWSERCLEPVYAMVFIDSLTARIREDGLWSNKRVHLALGILPDGTKDIIGFWIEPLRSGAHWPAAMRELKAHGVQTITLAVTEDTGACMSALRNAFPEAIVLPSVRHAAQRTAEAMPAADRAPHIRSVCRQLGDGHNVESLAEVRSALDLPPAVRQLVCSNTAVESVVEKLRRRGLSKRGNFSNTSVAAREIVFALQDAKASWKVSPAKWIAVKRELELLMADH